MANTSVKITPDIEEVPAIRFSGVSKAFGNIRVLQNVDLDIPAGQRLALIGPSGSGKTSLLRILMTLEQQDAGTIEIFGEYLGFRPDERSGGLLREAERTISRVRGQIGMVFQHFNLFPHMTALENIVEAPVHVLGVPRNEAREQALELLSMVGLADKADVYPRRLSGGQQQRVAIARALAMKPKIMLFDEITSALDPETVGEVLKIVRKLAHESGMTMLLVTHEMDFAREVSDRVLFMERGHIVEDDIPSNIFRTPKSERAKSFLKAILDR